jgi:hypothetical protein
MQIFFVGHDAVQQPRKQASNKEDKPAAAAERQRDMAT